MGNRPDRAHGVDRPITTQAGPRDGVEQDGHGVVGHLLELRVVARRAWRVAAYRPG